VHLLLGPTLKRYEVNAKGF